MGIEYEKKYRLTPDLFREIGERLAELGANFEGEDAEVNTIYNLQRITGFASILRIRTIGDRTVLTFKKRITSESAVKQQIEHETEVSNREATESIVAELGLTPDVVYEKRRATWSLRNAEVVLDRLPFGLYMEIEGTLASIAETEMLLEADKLAPEPLTYPNLTAQFGKRNGTAVEARFAPEDAEA